MSAPVRISYFAGGEKDRDPRGVDASWDQLCEELGSRGVKPSPCTLATCGTGENVYGGKSGQCCHKYGAAWSPAVYPPGATRSKKNVGSVSLLVLDLDHRTHDEIALALERLAPYRYIAHGSHSDQRPRPDGTVERAIRVVVALSEPVLGTEWPRFWETAVEMLGGDTDPACCDSSRLYFLPSRRSDAEFYFSTNEGKPIDVPAVLARAPSTTPIASASIAGDFPPASPAVLADAARRMASMPPAVEGEGGDRRTYSACCTLLHDYALTDEEAMPLLRAWNQTCRPPWSEEELRVKMDNARSYADGPRGAARVELEGTEAIREMFATIEDAPLAEPGSDRDLFEQALADVRNFADATADDRAEVKLLFVPALDVIQRTHAATPWLVPGLVKRGGIFGVVAPPKSTKTWSLQEIVVACASGSPAFGCLPTGEPIGAAYFFAEDIAPDVQGHLLAFAAGRRADPAELVRRLFVQPAGEHIDLMNLRHVAMIIASCRRIERDSGIKIGLVVLDPLRDVHSGKENESDDMGPVMARLKMIASLVGCTVGFAHHSKKPDGKEGGRAGNDVRGSGAIWGSLDSLVSLRDLKKTSSGAVQKFTTTVVAEVKGARAAEPFELELAIEDDLPRGTAISATWRIVGAEVPKADPVEDEGLSEVLGAIALVSARKPNAPWASSDEIRATVKGTKARVLKLLKKAHEDGLVSPHKRGKKFLGSSLTARGRDWLAEPNEFSVDDIVGGAP